jgi:hypothetical protein
MAAGDAEQDSRDHYRKAAPYKTDTGYKFPDQVVIGIASK